MVDAKQLESHLATRAYVDGYQPTSADVEAYTALGSAPAAAEYPHTARWYKHIASYASEHSSLPSGTSPLAASSSSAPAAAAEEEDDDDEIDLFGDDDEDDAEAERIKQERVAAYNEQKEAKKAEKLAAGKTLEVAKSVVTLQVKPWDDETDMTALEAEVRAIEKDGLLWGASKLVPVGYGIKMLQITLVIEDAKISLDELQEQIQEIEDYVQSTDIAAPSTNPSPTPADAAARAAALIIARIAAFAPTAHRRFVLVLPTGSTPVPVYDALVRACRAGDVSFEHVVTVNLDEYVGLGPDHAQSYYRFMDAHFWSLVDLPPSQQHIPYGLGDPLTEAARYEALLQSLGGAHLVLAGIGGNGHVGFIEPGSGLSGARCVPLSRETRDANARFFPALAAVPTHAITLGLRNIVDAAEVVVLATGAAKARAVADALEGAVTHLCPASILQLHDNARLIADADAAQHLSPATRAALTSPDPDLTLAPTLAPAPASWPADKVRVLDSCERVAERPTIPMLSPLPALERGSIGLALAAPSGAPTHAAPRTPVGPATPVSPLSPAGSAASSSSTSDEALAPRPGHGRAARQTRARTRALAQRPKLRLVVRR
ncbi:Translation elongation factor 1 beta [Cryptotrichosporon argae]